ncbi:MAG TPA: zinc ribbon domain-containing protein [Novosphingobium sp.]|nr:zinc ribbon domain-containing protein [Novosphingobium sp.]
MSYASSKNPLLDPFWEGARAHRLMLQQCHDCGNRRFPPMAACPDCLSENLAWSEASGGGRVLSEITFHQRYWPDRDPPYDVLLIELDEGPLMMSGAVEGHALPDVGDRVRVMFETRGDGSVIPQFVRDE